MQVSAYFGKIAPHLCRSLISQRLLHSTQDYRLWIGGYPHNDVNLRGSGARQYQLINGQTGEEIESLAEDFALRESYPGAIYAISQRNQLVGYRCGEWQRQDFKIIVEPLKDTEEHQITEPDLEFEIDLLSEIAEPKLIPATTGKLTAQLHWGKIRQWVKGYEEFLFEKTGACMQRGCSLFGKAVKGRSVCTQCNRKLKTQEEKKPIDSIAYENPLLLEYETPVLRLQFSEELKVEIEAFVRSERLVLEQQFPNEDDRPEHYQLLCSAMPSKLAYHCLLHPTFRRLTSRRE
jgi:hypothetical protein